MSFSLEEIKARYEAAQKRWKHVWIADLRDCITEIERLQKLVQAPKQCTWKIVDDDFGTYETSCGGMFTLTTDTPKDNKMKFCCYCGGELVEAKQGE